MRDLTLGLALGGGGMKGAAHVGVLGVLDEAGIAPHVVAGTSIGSLYGGLYAVGRTPKEIDEGIRSCPWTDLASFFRHRLKIRHPNKLSRLFYGALAGQHIESLPIRYAATASDMAEHRAIAISSGPIIDAIEASIALPFIAKPVAHQGRYLLDGGFWASVPVDAAVELGADVVVAVELGHPPRVPERFRDTAALLATKIDRFPLSRTAAAAPFLIHAASSPRRRGRTAQILLKPRVPAIGSSSPFHMVKCLEAGREAAREALPAIRALLAGEDIREVAAEFTPNAAPAQGLGFTTA